VQTEPPVFAFFCNQLEGIRDSYRRYMERQLRVAFDFRSVTLALSFRQIVW